MSYRIHLWSAKTAGSGAFSFKPTVSIVEVPGKQWFISSNERKARIGCGRKMVNFNSKKERGKTF